MTVRIQARLAGVVAAAAFSLPAQGTLYRVIDLGVAPSYPLSRAVDINDRGQVLVSANWPPRAYLHDPVSGELTALPTPTGATRFDAVDLNEAGQVIGAGLGTTSLFLYTPGSGFLELGGLMPGQPTQGTACGLNDLGEVVGGASGLAAGSEPFIWTQATGMLSVAPGVTGYLCGLNDSGEAIGQIGNQWIYWVRSSGGIGLTVPLSFRPDAIHDDGVVAGHTLDQQFLVLRDRFGTVTQIPTLTGRYNGWTVADRNAAGRLVGNWQYRVVNGSSVTFNTGTFIYLPQVGIVDLTPAANGVVDSAWEVETIAGINELGQIAGSGRLRTNVDSHAIRLDPVSPAAEVTVVGQGCGAGGGPSLSSTPPVIARPMALTIGGGNPNRSGVLLLGAPAVAPVPLLGCSLHLDPTKPIVSLPIATDAQGAWTGDVDLPPNPQLLGARFGIQSVVVGTPTSVEFSNGIDLTIGF